MEKNDVQRYVCFFSETYKPDGLIDIKFDNERKKAIFKTPLTNVVARTDNGVLYTRERMDQALASDFVQDRLKRRAMYGEMDHPSRTIDVERYMQVHNKERSHLHTDFFYEGDLLCGTIETAIGGRGGDMYDYLSQGSIPSFSLRAYGIMDKLPDGSTRENFRLLCWDMVFNGACRDAWADSVKGTDFAYRKYGETEGAPKGSITTNEGDIEKLYLHADVSVIAEALDVAKSDVSLFSESLNFEPSKVLYDRDGGVLAYYGETMSVKTQLKGDVRKDVEDFFKM